VSVRKENPFGGSLPITIEYSGNTYRGSYRVDGEMIYVTSDFGDRWATLGNSPPELIARIVLRELVESGTSKP
jgi:hypothetical protein